MVGCAAGGMKSIRQTLQVMVAFPARGARSIAGLSLQGAHTLGSAASEGGRDEVRAVGLIRNASDTGGRVPPREGRVRAKARGWRELPCGTFSPPNSLRSPPSP